jgi:hypothetical protein
MASPRGIKRESHRTGKDKTIASVKPPSSITGMAGAAHMSNTRAVNPSAMSKFRVLLEIRIGLGRAGAFWSVL